MVHEELYNVRDLPRKRGGEKLQKGHYSIIIYIDTQFQLTFIQGEPPQTRNLYIFRSTVIFRLPFKIILTIVQFIKAWFFTLVSTNLLFWAHWVNIPHIFGFGPQIETLQLALSMGRTCALVSVTVKYDRIRSAPGRVYKLSTTK